MYQTSDAFDAAILEDSMVVAVRADLYTAGLGTLLASDLPVTGGRVNIDRGASVRRSCNVQVVDDTGELLDLMIGTSAQLQQNAMELKLYRGLVFPNGSSELIPLGVFRVSSVQSSDTNQPTLSIAGYDRSRTVSRAKFTTTYYPLVGATYLEAAVALVQDRMPFVVDTSIESVNPLLLPTVPYPAFQEQDDPWERVQALVAVVGCEAYFEVDGSLRIRELPDPTLDPVVFEFVEGESSLLLGVDHTLDDEPGYNGVLVIGEGSGNLTASVRQLVYDNDPNSPTYWFGPYGQVPEFYTDDTITTAAQATALGTGRLRKTLGLTETMTVSAIPHPALAGGDVIRVKRDPSNIDIHGVLEQITIPLDLSTAMTLGVRSRRSV